MIKDSKLIGTKIDVPFGWKQFEVGELFDCKSIRQIPTGLDLDSVGDIPYVAQTSINNSITHYITEKSCLVLNKGHAIVLGVDTQWATYQEFDFYANKMISLYLKSSFSRFLTASVGLYMCSVLNKNFTIYDYNRKLSFHKLVSTAIDLPVTSDSQPDFEWMSAYIKAVKADYLAQKELANQREIKDYLTAGNVDSMDVTDADRQFLREFEKLPRRKFKVGELFDFKSSMSLNKSDLKFVSKQNPFAIPYITRTVLNNGINGYVDSRFVGDEYINYGNEFAFGLLGLVAFYQGNRYCTGQFVKRFVPKFELNELLAMFFKTLLDKQIELFKTVSISSYNKLINDVLDIELPVIANDEVDVHSIEKYMQIQVKLTIAKRKSYLDYELELMKQV